MLQNLACGPILNQAEDLGTGTEKDLAGKQLRRCSARAAMDAIADCRWNYFLGGVGIYMGTIIMEGAAMSLESKARTVAMRAEPDVAHAYSGAL